MSNNSYNFASTLDGIKSIEADNITTQTLSMTDLSVSGNFELGTILDVEQAIIDNTTALTGITYDSINDITNIDNNVTITSTKDFKLGNLKVSETSGDIYFENVAGVKAIYFRVRLSSGGVAYKTVKLNYNDGWDMDTLNMFNITDLTTDGIITSNGDLQVNTSSFNGNTNFYGPAYFSGTSNIFFTDIDAQTNVDILGTLSLPTYSNVKTTLDNIESDLTDISYDVGTDTTTVANNLNVTKQLNVNTVYNVGNYWLFDAADVTKYSILYQTGTQLSIDNRANGDIRFVTNSVVPFYITPTNSVFAYYATIPTETAGSNNTRIANTAFVTSAVSAYNTSLLSTYNTWTGTNNYIQLPESPASALSGNQLCNRTTVVGLVNNLLISNNTWTQTNDYTSYTTFNSNLPTSTITATTANQLCNYTTTTGLISANNTSLKASANNWTGNTNTFNSYLPTSTITATSSTQLCNYTTTTGLISANNTTLLSTVDATITANQTVNRYNTLIYDFDDFCYNDEQINAAPKRTKMGRWLNNGGLAFYPDTMVNHPGLLKCTLYNPTHNANLIWNANTIFRSNFRKVEWLVYVDNNADQLVGCIAGIGDSLTTFTNNISMEFVKIGATSYWDCNINGVNQTSLQFYTNMTSKWWLLTMIFTATTVQFQYTNVTDSITVSSSVITPGTLWTDVKMSPMLRFEHGSSTSHNYYVDFCGIEYMASRV